MLKEQDVFQEIFSEARKEANGSTSGACNLLKTKSKQAMAANDSSSASKDDLAECVASTGAGQDFADRFRPSAP
jgi:hypothetical protein